MIAVTGANGLLGSFIVRKLIEKKEPFVALKRKSSNTSLLDDVADKIIWRDADVLDPIALDEAFDNVTQVIHAAAYISNNPRKEKVIMDTNVIGTRNVVNTCLHRNIKRLVHISSVAALGRQKNQHHIDETNQWIDSPFNNLYSKSKYLAELEVFRGLAEGLHGVMVNPSVILAPADWNTSSARLFKYVWEQRYFYTDACINYVDVRDVAEITYQLLHTPVNGERFIVNAGNISVEQAFQKIAKSFDRRPPFIKLNKTWLLVFARMEAFRARVMRKEPIVTRETARLSGANYLFVNNKICAALSYNFLPVDESINWCCQFYKSKVQKALLSTLYFGLCTVGFGFPVC